MKQLINNPKYDRYQRGLASMVDKFFDEKSAGSGVTTLKTTNKTTFNNEKLAELHKPILRKLIKRTVYSGFKDNIWGADLANMQLISKFNKGFSFIMCY